jgi:flagellar basal body-associated protein FliL
MKYKKLTYSLLTLALMLGVGGATTVSAWGGFASFNKATPEEQATQATNRFAYEATLLGTSVDTVKQAWANGKTIVELAAELGITEDALRVKLETARQAEMKAHLQTLVSQGVITQAQADARLTFMTSKVGQGKGLGKGRGMHGMGMGRF